MTHTKTNQDLLYFKGIIDDYSIDLKVSKKEEMSKDLKIIVSIIN